MQKEVKRLLQPEFINEFDQYLAIENDFLAKKIIGRKMIPKYRIGKNAGNKDFKIVGDINEDKTTQLEPFGPKDLGGAFRKT